MSATSFETARLAFEAGVAAQQAGLAAEAEAHYRRSLAALPGRASTLANLGAALLAQDRADEALLVLDALLATSPAPPAAQPAGQAAPSTGVRRQALAHRAEALLALRRDAEALAAFETLLAEAGPAAPPLARLRRAECLARLDRLPQALAEAAPLSAAHPDWPEALLLHGTLLKDLGRHDQALPVLRQAQTLGSELAGFTLAALQNAAAGSAPPQPPPGYVQALFDGYAAHFEQHLVDALAYDAPQRLVQGLGQAMPGRRFASALDLGCGTGLAARALRAQVDRLEGVDLSAAMLAHARATGLYDALVQADALSHLAATPPVHHDLVVAVDFFIYLGDLAAVFAAVRRVLAAGGVFAFTVESWSGSDWALQPSARYAHAESYVLRLAAQQGLAVLQTRQHALRLEQRVPVPGHFFWLLAPG